MQNKPDTARPGPGPARQSKLRVEKLEKRYGQITALRPTDLDVASGEFLTLLGPSGSGKTTLLMMAAGLAYPEGGQIWIDGRLSTDLPPQQRDIGVVFQNYALFPHLSVFENVAYPLRMRRADAATMAREVGRVLEIVDLANMANRLPKELSGGQQQRVALARCAVYKPSIILMDEPLGALDRKLRDSMQMEIRRLHHELKSTILYVTHDQGEAMSMSDRICLMRSGGIEQVGTPADLYHRPVNRFVGDFLGGANFLEGTFLGSEGSHATLAAAGGVNVKARKPETAVSNGARALCMIRPQHVRIGSDPEPGCNSISATAVSSVLTGTVTEHHVLLADGKKFSAVDLSSIEKPTFAPGARVHVNWHPDNTTVFCGEQIQ